MLKLRHTIIKNDTILDGEIGEWDPTLDDNPDFDGFEIDGNNQLKMEIIILYQLQYQ
ncbi:MAG: hypothetical protein V8T82_05145 [Romboutsia timonensis]